MNTTNKRLINISMNGTIIRVPKELWLNVYKAQGWKPCNKASYRSLINKNVKLMNNENTLKNVNFTKEQKDNFVSEEENKVYGYKLMGVKEEKFRNPNYNKEEKVEKTTWLQRIIDKYFINPNDESSKKTVLGSILAFLGIFGKSKKKKVAEQEPEFIKFNLPRYTRYILQYK